MRRRIGFRGFGEEVEYINVRIEQLKSVIGGWFYEDLLSSKINFDKAASQSAAVELGGKFIDQADFAMESANLTEEEKVAFVSDVADYVSKKVNSFKEVAGSAIPVGAPTAQITGGGIATATKTNLSPWLKVGAIGLVIWAMMS